MQKLTKFIIAFVILIVVAWFVIPMVVKPKLEALASDVHGAQVDIGDLGLGLFPLSVALEDIEVTDKKAPMKNQVVVGLSTFALEFGPLLAGKVIIPNAEVSGVYFNTDRASEGFVTQAPATDATASQANPLTQYFDNMSALGDLKNLDAQALLAKEPLQSVELAQSLEAKLSSSKNELEALQAQLPSKDSLKDLESKVKAITDKKIKSVQDFQESKQALDELLSEAKSYKSALSEAKETLTGSVSEIKNDYSSIKTLAQQDLDYLKGKYSLDVSGLSNLTGLLLEESAGEWVRELYGVYQMIEPHLGSSGSSEQAANDAPVSETQEVVDEDDSLPDFLIKRLRVADVVQEGLRFDVLAENITHQQERVGAPLSLAASALDGASKLGLNGVIDRLSGTVNDQLSWQVADWPLPEFSLGVDEALIETSILLTSGQLNRDGNGLNGEFTGQLLDLVYRLSDTKDSSLGAQFVFDALQSISTVDFSGALSGAVEAPDWSLRSNLDNQLKSLLSKQVTSSNSLLNTALSGALTEQLSGSESAYAEYLSFSENESLNISELDQSVNSLLDRKLESVKDQVKDKLESTLKDKLKNFF